MISFERARKLFVYCPETGDFTHIFSRPGVKVGTLAGSKPTTDKPYINIKADGKMMLAHRLAFVWMGEALPSEVDHINGNPSDNRWSNLRPVTRLENSRNTALQRNSNTGIPGVNWYKQTSRWHAKIYVQGRSIYLGFHLSFLDACCARKAAENNFNFHRNHGRKSA